MVVKSWDKGEGCAVGAQRFFRGWNYSVLKNLPANAVNRGLRLGSGRWPGEGNGNPFQYSCLWNPMDKKPWQATVHGVTKESDTTQWLNSNNNKGQGGVFTPSLHHVGQNMCHQLLRSFFTSSDLFHEPLSFLFQTLIIHLDILLVVPVGEEPQPLRRGQEVTRPQSGKWQSKQASKILLSAKRR